MRILLRSMPRQRSLKSNHWRSYGNPGRRYWISYQWTPNRTANGLSKVLSNIQFTWLSRKIKASLQSQRLHQKNCFNNNTILKRRSYSETMVNDREVSLGWTCFCYSWEIIQRFLLELSAFSLYIDKTCVTDVFSKSPLLNTDTMACPLGVRINRVPNSGVISARKKGVFTFVPNENRTLVPCINLVMESTVLTHWRLEYENACKPNDRNTTLEKMRKNLFGNSFSVFKSNYSI